MKFIRQDAHKKAKLKKVWRKPKGLQNKMRLQKKGYRRLPKAGMGTPNVEKHKINGKDFVRVSSVAELANTKGKVVLVAAVGMKKKIQILEEGLKQKVEFAFNAKEMLDNFNKELSERKKSSEEYKKERDAKQKEAKEEKKEAKPAEEAEEKSAEEKKKELDKELIKRQ